MDPVVILGTDVVSVGPGQEQRIPVRVRNQGRRVESYRVDVVGVPAQFAEVVPNQVSVLPGREAELDVVFRPPGGASTPTGTLPFTVHATSQVDASSSAVAEARLELAGVAGLQAWATETTRSGRWSAKYHLEFLNQGNAALRLALWARDPAAATRVKVVPDVVDMTAGGRATAVVDVKARNPFLRGSVQNRTLQADCQTFPFGTERPIPSGVPPVDDPYHRTFQLSFQQKPILPRFLLPLLAVVVAAALAFAVLTLRKTTGVSLDVANAFTPVIVGQPTSDGDKALLLAWQPVPNAEGYEIRQVSRNDQPVQQVIEAELPADQTSKRVDGLEASTSYCYVVRALGPDDHDSTPSEPICGTTGAPTVLAAPEITEVTPDGDGKYKVTWTYQGVTSDKLQFQVFVDGTGAEPTPLMEFHVPIESGAEERVAKVHVRALQDDQVSPLSAERPVTIPALPAEPTSTAAAETTVAVPTTAPGTGGGPGGAGGPGDATTTTVAGATTTTAATTTTVPSTPATTELQNLEPTWVAMLGQVTPGSVGGVPTEQRKEDLAKAFNVPATDLKVFTNRDTIATTTENKLARLNTGPASNRYIYLPTNDPATATDICTRAPNCEVLQLVGVARQSERKEVLLLELLDATTTTTSDVDTKLDAARAKFTGHGVYAVSGAAYPALAPNRILIFVTGFADAAERQAFCASNSIQPCQPVPFAS